MALCGQKVWCLYVFAGRVLSGLAVLNCLQQPLLQAAQPRLLAMLRDGSIDVQVCAALTGNQPTRMNLGCMHESCSMLYVYTPHALNSC